MKKTAIIPYLFLFILLAGNSIAFNIGLFPMRQGYRGWHVETTIQIYNNMSEPLTFKIYATNPVNHTRYNSRGIYDTITDGKDMKEYRDFPDLSWIKLPDKVTVEAKNGSNYTVKEVPVIVDIPQKYEYSGKHYEALICAETVGNQTIHISLASRLLITTPTMPNPKMPFIPIWLVISIIIAFTIVKRIK